MSAFATMFVVVNLMYLRTPPLLCICTIIPIPLQPFLGSILPCRSGHKTGPTCHRQVGPKYVLEEMEDAGDDSVAAGDDSVEAGANDTGGVASWTGTAVLDKARFIPDLEGKMKLLETIGSKNNYKAVYEWLKNAILLCEFIVPFTKFYDVKMGTTYHHHHEDARPGPDLWHRCCANQVAKTKVHSCFNFPRQCRLRVILYMGYHQNRRRGMGPNHLEWGRRDATVICSF